jgi:hypothetical protein
LQLCIFWKKKKLNIQARKKTISLSLLANKIYIPINESSPQASHIIRLTPTEPVRTSNPLGLTKIPEPNKKDDRSISDMIWDEMLICRTYINDLLLIILKLQTQMEFVHALLKSKKVFKSFQKKLKKVSNLWRQKLPWNLHLKKKKIRNKFQNDINMRIGPILKNELSRKFHSYSFLLIFKV